MNWKRHLTEAATLVAAAFVCALVANALAARERRLALPGSYPNATTVPPRPATTAAAAAAEPQPTPPPEASPVVTALAPTATRPPEKKGTPAAAASPTPAPVVRLTERFPPHPDKPWVEISGEDAALLHAGGALVLDARRTSVYQEGHIAGAQPFPIWEAGVDRQVEALVNEGRDPKQPVVVYCAGGDCEDSHMLAQKLFGAGFENVLVYPGGWPDWQKRGGPSRQGEKP